jgi:hypothetical protein
LADQEDVARFASLVSIDGNPQLALRATDMPPAMRAAAFFNSERSNAYFVLKPQMNSSWFVSLNKPRSGDT